MNPAVFFLLLSTNARNGAYSPIASIDQPDDYLDDNVRVPISAAEWVLFAVALAALISMAVTLYEVIVVGDLSWPA